MLANMHAVPAIVAAVLISSFPSEGLAQGRDVMPTLSNLLAAGYRVVSHSSVQVWRAEGHFTNMIGGQHVSWPLIKPFDIVHHYVLQNERRHYLCEQSSRESSCRALN